MKYKKYDLLVIAGTYDARILIESLNKYNISILATVATQNGKDLLDNKDVEVHIGRLDEKGFGYIMYNNSIKCVLDASHPYADKVTKIVYNVCKNLNISYIRYLRPSSTIINDNILYVKDIISATVLLNNIKGNILLTTGSKDLEIFINELNDYKQRLFVRVLPVLESIRKCENLGIPVLNIIAMGGYFTTEMNKEILKHCNTKILVTKDGGNIGGFDEKIAAAYELSIKTIVIQRPLEFTDTVDSYESAIENVLKILNYKREGLNNA